MPQVSTSIWRVPGMPALAVATILGFSGFAALLPVAPLWAVRGGADAAGAGLVNGVLLLATVATQGFVPRALARAGWGVVLAAGLVLLGAPAVFMGATDALGPLLALSAVRGVGFGVLTVCGGAAVAELVAPARRGAGIGAYGLAVALPNVIALPVGPWVAERFGFGVVFALGALPVLGIPAAFVLARAIARAHARRATDPGPGPAHPHDAGSTRAALARLVVPCLLLFSVTLAGGGLLTFAPQMIADAGRATLVLFVVGVVAALARWYAGPLADARGAGPLVWPLTVVTVVGLGLIGWALSEQETRAAALFAGAALVGLSYGALQNLTLVLSFQAVPQRQVGMASAVWNVGFDAGTALASIAIGAVAARTSFPTAMFVVAAACAAAVPLALTRAKTR